MRSERIMMSQALGASEGAPPLHIEIEPSGGPLNRMFGRGTPLRSRVATPRFPPRTGFRSR